jgi:hypothetical protein
MKVSSIVDTTRYHRPEAEGQVRIEFALPDEGGNSSAGEKFNFTEKSVRLAWRNQNGGFDPISSGELPDWGMMDVMEACAAKDFFTVEECRQLIGVIEESINRQLEA